MRLNPDIISEIFQKCIITTSTYLLNFYEHMACNSKIASPLIYNCLHEENADTIPAAYHYEIIIDFNNHDIYNIIVKMFNNLLKFNCNLHVKILPITKNHRQDIKLCIKLLKKLERNNLIKLEIQNDKGITDIRGSLNYTLDNVICFIGPGNTGKTSIMASVSELFCEKKQRIALLDLTKENKLKEYFPYNTNISHIFTDHNSAKAPSYDFTGSRDNFPNLYICDPQGKYGSSEIIFLCKTIKHLSKSYDFVLVNADKHGAKNFIDIFKLFSNIFIVHDCMLNKIHSTHKMLLNLQESGIDTQKAVSIIYNKVIKKASDMGNIEENLIFKRDEKGHLLPLIDIKCMTLEIFHNRKIAVALNNKITTKTNALNRASVNYIINIKRLYNFINNLEDCEYSDLQLSEFIRNHVYDIVYNFFSMKINHALKYKIVLNNIYNTAVIGLEKCINSIKEIRSKYLKKKFVA